MDLSDYLKSRGVLIEEKLDVLIPEKNAAFASLFQAARYSLLGGGKRLRPLLAIAVAETFGKPPESALVAGCAIEMIHTYSLIHDDLPCMDNDDFRRGKPSLHKQFGEAQAVLTGDYLLTYAFEVIANDNSLSSEQKIALISLIAKSAGCQGMIAGQVMDTEAEGRAMNLESLEEIHHHKTGALINASLLAGGIAAGAERGDLQALHRFGTDIGLAFQIVDDILDVTSSQAKLGKPAASDAKNGKTTYASLLGIPSAQAAAETLYCRSMDHLAEISRDTSLLQFLAKRLVHREY